MSNDFSLSPELEEIERRIGRRRFEAPGDARLQVLAVVRFELAKPPAAPAAATRRWAFAGAIAAALLIGANLSLIGASVTRFIPEQPVSEISSAGSAVAQNRSADWIDDDPRVSVVLSSPRKLPAIPSLPSSGHAADLDFGSQGIVP
jgi:hypothetical protein